MLENVLEALLINSFALVKLGKSHVNCQIIEISTAFIKMRVLKNNLVLTMPTANFLNCVKKRSITIIY